ncbi:MAG TPA: hypothetical protein VH593_22705 [Ktedonobacteraceae bacterium]|jgi:hypothetical protein
MLALGIDGIRYLESRDDFERSMLISVAQEAFKVRQTLDNNLAVEIATKVSKLFG